MRRPVQRGSRDATTSACVGWDFANIENRPAFRKEPRSLRYRRHRPSKRLHCDQDNGSNHQDSRYLIDNAVKFFTSGIAVGAQILDAAGKKTVDARQHQYQQKLYMKTARPE